MSQLISRILLTILIFPATVLFYCVAFLLIEELLVHSDEAAVVVAAVLSSAFMIAYWCLLWRRTVAWTPQRLTRTFAALGGAAAAGGVIGASMLWLFPDEQWVAAFFSIACGSVAWIILTIFVWREATDERAERLRGSRDAVVCPNCGYNLTGLSGTRCPECGRQYTINELLAEQPARAAAEVEAS
jgi:hypothetical protein